MSCDLKNALVSQSAIQTFVFKTKKYKMVTFPNKFRSISSFHCSASSFLTLAFSDFLTSKFLLQLKCSKSSK